MRRKRSGLPATCAASIHPPSTRSARSGFIFPENPCRKPRQKAVSPIALIIENLDQQNEHDQERDLQSNMMCSPARFVAVACGSLQGGIVTLGDTQLVRCDN